MPSARLLTLQVDNLGPIDHATLDFGEGLTVLTGETGAGKTLLVGALTLCAGASDERGVRHAGPLAVSAVFDDGEREVSLSRRDDGGTRLRSYVDGTVASAAALREVAAGLVTIFGQAASHRLRQAAEFTRLVDEFGDVDATILASAKSDLAEARRDLAAIGGDRSERDRETTFLQARIAEIDRVAPTSASELDEVLVQLSTLELLRSNYTAIVSAADHLSGDDATSVTSVLADVEKSLPTGGPLDDVIDRVRSLRAEATELARTLSTLHGGAVPEPNEIDALNVRASDLHHLARSFGGTLEHALDERVRLATALEELESSTSRAASLLDRIEELQSTVDAECARLRAVREDTAHRFVTAVQSHFAAVALPRAVLSATVGGVDGSEISVGFSSDDRRPPGPLQNLASGGELARVMLAISLECVSTDVVAVFDEVDAGIGGAVAERIGECLRTLSERQQVIVVTHLASIAAVADHHFVVEGATADRATAVVREVTGDARVQEVARMLSGESAPDAARALAIQLLAPSQ